MSSLDDLSRSIVPQLFLILILTLINAFFASAEMAFVSVNKHKIKSMCESGDKKAILLNKLLQEPSNFLSTIQIGITLAGFFSSASAATTLSSRLYFLLSPYCIPYGFEISMVLITLVLSYFTLVFGELVPKRIALKKCELIAFSSVKLIYLLSILVKPFINILSISTKLVLRLTGNNINEENDNVSADEIKLLITESEKVGVINCFEKEIINKVFEFSDKTSKEIMTSRTDTILIDVDDDYETKLNILLSCKYSRIPVYRDYIDNIIGILYIKDLASYLIKNTYETFNFEDNLHQPLFIPETKNIDELFMILKQSKNHMSILVDEYGGFSGIVTMEDIVEEIMGDIDDEYDIDNHKISVLDDGSFIVKGNMSLLDFNSIFKSNIKCENCDTINGYIISTLNRIPNKNENIYLIFEKYKLEVLEVEDNRVDKVKISLMECRAS